MKYNPYNLNINQRINIKTWYWTNYYNVFQFIIVYHNYIFNEDRKLYKFMLDKPLKILTKYENTNNNNSMFNTNSHISS